MSTAVHLRFNVPASTLPDYYKSRLLHAKDSRISNEGVIIIKAQRFRSQEKNKEDALNRLLDLIKQVTVTQKKRQVTKPTKASKKRRLDGKTKRGHLKTTRGKIDDY